MILAAAALAVVSGCASPGLSFGRTAKTVQTHPDDAGIRPVSADDMADEGGVVQADYRRPANDELFRDSRPIDAGGDNPGGGDTGATRPFRDPGVRPVSAEGPPEDVSRRLSSATLRLVDAELADATPEERAEFYETIRDVDPQLVPHMLRLRRTMTERAKLRESELREEAVRKADIRGLDLPRTAGADPAPAEAAMDIRPREAAETLSRPDPSEPKPDATEPPFGGEPPAALANAIPPAAQTPAADPTAGRPSAEWPPNDAPPPRDVPPAKTVVATPVSATTPLTDENGRYVLANDYDEQLAELIDLMERDLAGRAEPTSDAEREEAARLHVFLRMLYLMDGQQARTMQSVPHLPETHQEFWTQLFWGLSNYFDSQNIPDSGARATEAVTQLREAAERLRPEARLLLKNAAFCHRIDGFGKYARFDRDEFTPGQRVLVYLEAENFASRLDDGGEYATRLRTTVEFHRAGRGPQAGLIDSTDFPTTEDTCRSPRRDYFNAYDIYLPQNLSSGPHVLKLIVEDEQSHRVATASLNFTVR